jgi:hypothetical protein
MNIKTKFMLGGASMLLAFTLIPQVFAATAPTVTTVIRDSSSNTITSALVGSNVFGVATVASSTGTPTGSVTFNIFQNTSCSGATTTQTVNLTNAVATTSAVSVPATGLSFQVHYNGDSGNTFADSVCQVLTPISNNVSISTNLSSSSIQAGSLVSDSATLTNKTATAGGSVNYKVYSNNSCTTLALDAGSKSVTNGTVPSSDSWQFITPGTYYWQAVYSGDTNNSAATSTCSSEVLNVLATTTQAGHIIVDKITNPSGDATSFHFSVSGTGYNSFNLTDQGTPNNQTLAAGNYTISEDSMSGWTLSGATCSINGSTGATYTLGSTLALPAGGTIMCTFTNTKNSTTTQGTGSIFGTVYNDLNKNDKLDSGEQGLPGFTIKLHGTSTVLTWSLSHGKKLGIWKHQPVIATATSDANGNYSFGTLPAGTYFVEEVLKKDWKQTTSDTKVVLDATHTSVRVDFGNVAKHATSTKDHEDNDKHDNDNHGNNGNNATTTMNREEIRQYVQSLFQDLFSKLKNLHLTNH